MKKKIIKGLIIYGAVFLIFFIFRMIYGYTSYPDGQTRRSTRLNLYSTGESGLFSFGKSNIASYKQKKIVGRAGLSRSIEQKYERVAKLSSRTNDFNKDNKKLRDTIKNYNALIQYENNSGLKGNRVLKLSIGVNPGKFDEIVKEISKIGKIQSKDITKVDKTNEFKNLNAKKKSLLRIRNSLMSLKKRSGKINEFIQLENKILEVDEKIQKLGVKLGEFDDENEFCTVKFSLREKKLSIRSISFLHRVKVALEWAIKFYIFLTIMMILGVFFVFISVVFIEKMIRVYKKIENK